MPLGDTIGFFGDDRYRRTRVSVTQDLPGGTPTVSSQTWEGVVWREKGYLTLRQAVCDDPNSLALCTHPDAVITSGEDIIISTSLPPGGQLLFVRQ